MACITIKYLSTVEVPVVNSLPENVFFVVAIDCRNVPEGFEIFVGKNGELFAVKKTNL